MAADEGEGEGGVDLPKRSRVWWWQRPTIRELLRQQLSFDDMGAEFDAQENERTRLAEGESVHLAGFTLVEAFTPSTVAKLYEVLTEWEGRHLKFREGSHVAALERSRSTIGGGWSSLGFLRPPGTSIMIGPGSHDPTLPTGVDAVWLNVRYVSSSIALVAATFTITEEAGDLSQVLRTDTKRKSFNHSITVEGRFGQLRGAMWWARPRLYGWSSSSLMASQVKEKAVESRIAALEDACGAWFARAFPGKFSRLPEDQRPHTRIVLTAAEPPFDDDPRGAFAVARIGSSYGTYLGTDKGFEGWHLQTRSQIMGEGRDARVWTFAARRSDVGEHGLTDSRGDTNWGVTQRFSSEHVGLVALHGLRILMDEFFIELARLRDDAGGDRRFPRPVREAKRLNQYLVTTGLDTSAFASDIAELASNLDWFRWGVPEYMEVVSEQARNHGRSARDLVPDISEGLAVGARRLGAMAAQTQDNLRASAELRQAIENTRLQRIVILVSVVTLIVATLTLMVA